MQIMIDIDDDIAQRIIDGKKEEPMNIVQAYPATIAHAIKEGVFLPKGHGDLIDKKEVYKKFYCRCLARVAKEVLDETPTIIEADKEGK